MLSTIMTNRRLTMLTFGILALSASIGPDMHNPRRRNQLRRLPRRPKPLSHMCGVGLSRQMGSPG